MIKRFKRTRSSIAMRELVADVSLDKKDFIYPIFVVDGQDRVESIESMPGQSRYSVDKLHLILKQLEEKQIMKVLLFGIPFEKDECGTSALDENGVIPLAIQAIKKHNSDFLVIADVCMCEYTSHGHCGVMQGDAILNDPTVELLSKISLMYAKAGADIVAPSDMHDGRVQAIRKKLDKHNFHYVAIMSYSAKYSSAFYGPFRDAAESAPQSGDRKSYQLDYKSKFIGIESCKKDIQEGADIIIIKPGMPYLDIISSVRSELNIPIAAYNVSGEYAMVKFASMQGCVNEREVVLEMLYAFKRAGANMIITYFALDAADYLSN